MACAISLSHREVSYCRQPPRRTAPCAPAFKRRIISELPSLGWLFQFNPASSGELICGSSVQVTDNGFHEGCWAKFPDEKPEAVATIFGSGMQTRNGKWLFLTASHPLESLFFSRHSKGWSVSNSLSFLVAYHRLKMPWDARYGATFASISKGIDAYEKRLFGSGDDEVFKIACDNFELDSNGNFHLIRKSLPPPFPSFRTYSDYLRQTLKLVFQDGAERGYRPLATCSTGYDSACAATLAAELSCREAVTLKSSRGGDNDSGKIIAERLGLRVHEFERRQNVEQKFEEVVEFLATGTGGEDYCYRNFEPVLKRRILLTGFRGGNCWDTHNSPNPVFGEADLSGCSLQEFRLWNDFIHLPVPTIGARRQPELLALSNSAEMTPFRLNNDYDRPIPRSIVEQAGIPREWFGQKKRAASTLLFFDRSLFASAVRREYEASVPRSWLLASKFGLTRALWELRYFGYRTLDFTEKKVRGGTRIRAIPRTKNRLVQPWRIFEHSHPRAALEFLAAVAVVGRRYRRALNREVSPE